MRRVAGGVQGQTGTEYMLVVSVIVIAVVGAAYVFVPRFEEGVNELGRDVRQVLAIGDVGGIGHDGGTTVNGSTPKLDPGSEPLGSSTMAGPANEGIANGGFSGMMGRPDANIPAESGTAPSTGLANGGSSGD